jgi:alginate O-acetyltransferase complex protein AlgI
MGKKLIIADTLAKTADQIFAIPSVDLTASLAWLGIICYTLQLYFDFSGYTDMAIGLGRMFGFTFRENFDYPYIARSVTEFWRRWHISLSTWFRDYLFTPLSYALMTAKIRKKIAEGKYKTNYRGLFSVFVVFTLCGLWHGPSWNFILWGMLHGIILAFENWKFSKVLKKTWAPLTHAYLLFFVMTTWVFFRSPTLSVAMNFLKAMAGFGSGTGITYNSALFIDAELLVVLTIAILAAMPTVTWGRAYLNRIRFFPENLALPRQFRSGYALEMVFVAVIFAVSLVFVAGSTYKPSIYLQF